MQNHFAHTIKLCFFTEIQSKFYNTHPDSCIFFIFYKVALDANEMFSSPDIFYAYLISFLLIYICFVEFIHINSSFVTVAFAWKLINKHGGVFCLFVFSFVLIFVLFWGFLWFFVVVVVVFILFSLFCFVCGCCFFFFFICFYYLNVIFQKCEKESLV